MGIALGNVSASTATIIEILLSIIGILLIPLIALMLRMAIKRTQTEDDVKHLIMEVQKLVADKDKVHAAMLDQMREDRQATNRRLEYLESIWIELGYKKR